MDELNHSNSIRAASADPDTSTDVLQIFHPAIQGWFRRTFAHPTPPQILGWPCINREENVLILSPTGSGKTMAAFLVCLNKLLQKLEQGEAPDRVFILYISPLKALNYDIERNLELPLQGIQAEAERLHLKLPRIRQAVRTGDTLPEQREQMLKHPPHLLITTPESLHLLLTAKRSRPILASVRYVIVDEIHALSPNKRGTFLMLLLERLAHLVGHNFVRIGLSATQKPLERIAEFLGGYESTTTGYHPRPVQIIDAGMRKTLDLKVIPPVENMAQLPEHSIWPAIYQMLLELIQSHRSTLIFANNRTAVEKITARVNELAGFPIARAHHGSVAKPIRHEIEQQLKAGELPALVATATLELGIDMGAIDLVCQVESPHSVATGLQRVGRAGHLYGAASKGRLLPKMRTDLLEMAALARAMDHGEVAAIKIPQNCLDVLAQQIVAMVAVENWEVDALFRVIRGATPFQHLPQIRFFEVLEMLSGRYPANTFRDLKPRLSWDRIQNILYPLPGSQRVVILNGGVIAETGQYPIYLETGLVKLGELEEEFVFESRLGDNFQMGTNTWKIVAIEPNRVLVRHASGQAAKFPFWKGDILGRDLELGAQVGLLSRQLKARLATPDCLQWLQTECHLDAAAAWNLREFFLTQKQSGSSIPDDQTVVIESFRDELGDPQVILLSPFGRRIHYAWRLAILAKVQQHWHVELETSDSDQGILFRAGGIELQQLVEIIRGIRSDELTELVTYEIANSPLFGTHFRHNAGRALLLTRQRPGKRTPLWLLRMRSRNLLEIVKQFESFPIVVETYRELLQDFLAIEELTLLLERIASGEIQMLYHTRQTPSPFCSALRFDFMTGYMYQYDQPKLRALAAPSPVSYADLADLLQTGPVTTLFSAAAIQDLEQKLQAQAFGYQARDAVELIEFVHRLGDLTTDELSRCYLAEIGPVLQQLTQSRRLCRIFIPGAAEPWRWIATEDFPHYQSAFAQPQANSPLAQFRVVNFNPEDTGETTPIEAVLPAQFRPQNLENARSQFSIIENYLRHHTFVTTEQISQRYGLTVAEIDKLLEPYLQSGELVSIPAHADITIPQLILKENLERLRRVTLTRQRREIQPCATNDFVQFLLRWQHLAPDTQLKGEEGVLTLLEQLQGRSLPFSIWENQVLTQRLMTYQSNWLDNLIQSGEIAWFGGRGSSEEHGEIQMALIENLSIFQKYLRPETAEPLTEEDQKILATLQEHGACFLTEIVNATHQLPADCANRLWRLIWAGCVTNDSWRVLRRGKPEVPARHTPETARTASMIGYRKPGLLRRGRSQPTGGGRWSRLPSVSPEAVPGFETVIVQQLLLRYGMLCREIFELENFAIPWYQLYETLIRLEWQGEIRRGYFVQGLSGAQFALPSVVDELFSLKTSAGNQPGTDEYVLINSCDPANLYGAAAPLAIRHPLNAEYIFRRHPNNFLVLRQGLPLLAFEANGNRLVPLQLMERAELLRALKLLPRLLQDPAGLNRLRRLKVEWWDGQPIRNAPVVTILTELGFRDEFKSLVLERQF